MTCLLLPLTFDSMLLLPWTGAAVAVMAAAVSANLYGEDGTALWLTLLTPGPSATTCAAGSWPG